jgi:hypothetical protein
MAWPKIESLPGEPTRYGIYGPAPPGASVPSLVSSRLLTKLGKKN